MIEIPAFGVELELPEGIWSRTGRSMCWTVANDTVPLAVADAKFKEKCVEYCTSPKVFAVKTDHCGPEITTPVLKATSRNVKKMADFIFHLRRRFEEMGYDPNAFVHNNCGIHVHLDIHDLTDAQRDNILRVYYSFEDLLYRLCHNRRNSRWCTSVRRHVRDSRCPTDADQIFRNFARVGIRWNRPAQRDTIEIRYSHATLDPVHMLNWVTLNVVLTHIAVNWTGKFDTTNYEGRLGKQALINFLAEKKHVRGKFKLKSMIPELIKWLEEKL